MDRPKNRRRTLIALVLLAGGAWMLLGRQWAPSPEQIPTHAKEQSVQPAERQLENVQRANVSDAAPSGPTKLPAPSKSPATGLRGRIIDAVTRQPVQEFDVRLIRIRHEASTEDEPITRHFKTANGRFSWADVAAGAWRATVAAPGYQQFNVDEFQVSESEATRELVMPLLRGLRLRGRVFALNTGAGVADAWISFRRSDVADRTSWRADPARSKEDGSFALDGIPAGDIVLIVRAEGHAFRELQVVMDETTPAQEIGLSVGGTIAGTVQTNTGVPVNGRVRLQGPGPNYFSELNEAGQFAYEHMPPGRYRVQVDTSAGSASQDFVLGPDEIKDGITLVVRAGRTVRGIIKNLRSKEVRLLLRSSSGNAALSASPNESGVYMMNGVPPGRALVALLGDGLVIEKHVDVPADQDVTLDITLPIGARLSGRVTQDGKPLAYKNVWTRPVESKSCSWCTSQATSCTARRSRIPRRSRTRRSDFARVQA